MSGRKIHDECVARWTVVSLDVLGLIPRQCALRLVELPVNAITDIVKYYCAPEYALTRTLGHCYTAQATRSHTV